MRANEREATRKLAEAVRDRARKRVPEPGASVRVAHWRRKAGSAFRGARELVGQRGAVDMSLVLGVALLLLLAASPEMLAASRPKPDKRVRWEKVATGAHSDAWVLPTAAGDLHGLVADRANGGIVFVWATSTQAMPQVIFAEGAVTRAGGARSVAVPAAEDREAGAGGASCGAPSTEVGVSGEAPATPLELEGR